MADSEFLESADDLTLPRAPGALAVRETLEAREIVANSENLGAREVMTDNRVPAELAADRERRASEIKTSLVLSELKRKYPNINFDSTIVAFPRITSDGRVLYKYKLVRDKEGKPKYDRDGKLVYEQDAVCIYKKLYELTIEDIINIRKAICLNFYFHGLGGGGKNLEWEAASVYGDFYKKHPRRNGDPLICVDWHGDAATKVKECELAARDLAKFLHNVMKIRSLFLAALIGCSMGNLSMKAFVDEALKQNIELEDAKVYYSYIALLHPKSLAFSKEDRDKIDFVGVDYMVPFRYKDKPFTIGFDIVHLMRYTKDFIKRQAKLLGYDDRYIAILSGKNMVEPVNTYCYQIEKIIEKSFDTSKAKKLLKKHPGFIEELRGKGGGRYTEFLEAWDKRSSQTASSNITR